MKRSIEMCGTVVLCLAASSCSILPPPTASTSGPVAPQPESKTAVPEAAEEPPQPQAESLAKSGGRRENLTCFSGTEDRHARIGVELVNDQVNYFAYYSKWRPRTCSIEAGRGDALSHWTDNGSSSTVTLGDRKGRRGKLQIERNGGTYRFAFQDVDRVRYCGMTGKINGSLIVTRGKSRCVVEGVMDGHAL